MITTLPQRLGSNATLPELVDHIRHHYPNLGPVLNQLIDRVDELIELEGINKTIEAELSIAQDERDKFKDQIHELESSNPREATCPHCGSIVSYEVQT